MIVLTGTVNTKEKTVVPAQKDLAQAHLTTPATPEGLSGAADTVLVRYDGMTRNGEPVVYAVLTVDALARVPASTMQGLGMLVRAEDDSLRGSPHAFFRQTPAGVSLYVDTDVHETFLGRFVDACKDNGVMALAAMGDLDLMRNGGEDIDPPAQAAFMVNGFPPVPVRNALEIVREKRAELQDRALVVHEQEPETDDTVSPGF